MEKSMDLTSIGSLHVDNGRFFVRVDPLFRNGLLEIEGFSHLHLVYWAHGCDNDRDRRFLVADKPYKVGPDSIGVFATRSEYRPNPILTTIVPVVSVDITNGIIELAYHDGLNNSPVLDIKPYLPSVDRVMQTQAASWTESWPTCYEDSGSFDWPSVFNFA